MIKNHLRPIIIFFALAFVFVSILHYVAEFTGNVKYIERNPGTYTYNCRITEFPYEKSNKIRVFADVINSDSPYNIHGYKIQFDLDKDNYDILKYGNIITVTGTVKTANTSANYGNFDYRNYLMSKNTIAICSDNDVDKTELVSQSNGLDRILYNLQLNAIFSIEKYFDGDDRALIKAMLTGDRADISSELTDMYQKAGIYHIVSVSGLHTGIFISVIAYLLAMLPIGKRKASIVAKISAVIISVLIYMFTGYGISITRVIVMCAITAFCMMVKRKYNIIMCILTAAYIIVLIMPYQIFSTAFQLSFLSTFGLCVALNILQKYSNKKQPGYLSTSLSISAGSVIATAPVCAYCFGFISVIALVANIVVIPLSNMLLISSALFCISSAVFPEFIMNIIKYVPMTFSTLINSATDLVTNNNIPELEVNTTQIVFIYIAVVLIGCIVILFKKRHFVVAATSILASVMLFTFICLPSSDMKVTFINCLNGESTLVTTPNGTRLLFDCGSASFETPKEDLFETYFKHHNISKIDTLYISYYDEAHTNAVNKLIVGGYIKQIVLPPKADITNDEILLNRKKIINTASNFGTQIKYTESEYSHITEDGVVICTIGNNFRLKNKNATAVYKIQYGNISFLLSSCIGAKGQELLTDVTDCTVIKTPNFGNWVKATPNYIMGANPEYAVITAIPDSKYYKVDEKLKKLLNDNNIPMYRTDVNQTITFTINGAKIKSIKTRRDNN